MDYLRNLTWGALCILLLFVACKDEKLSTAYDSGKPVELVTFMPDSGGIRTEFIIKGTNFGDDKSKVKVFFTDEKGKERGALVLGVVSDAIYALVPKQAGGQSHIRVMVEDVEANNADSEKTFEYIVTSSVSTVVGKAKEPGNKDGALGETTFNTPRYVAVDNENNLFVFDVPNVRLCSTVQNKTITLYTASVFNQPTFLDKDRNKLITPGDQAESGCFLFDATTSWVPEPYGTILPGGAYAHSVVFFPTNEDGTPTDNTFIITRQNSGPLYAQKFKKGMKYNAKNSKKIGQIGTTGANSLAVYNPIDKYYYISLNNFNAIYRFKLKMGADGWPELDGEIEHYLDNGSGYADGGKDEARFNAPQGIAVDSEGNIYVADKGNHCIRKIDTRVNIVTTIAGIPRSAGYKDGDPLDAQFNNPWGLCFDKDDILYIADQSNHCIRKLAIE